MSPEIAIVGSGPSGFFAAEASLAFDTGTRVHMFERLPTPYGLVRSGVAPDHQNIKQVTRVFEAILRNPNFSFFGNVEIGRNLTLEALRSRYDAVVLAYGAAGSAPLDIPGVGLPGSLTAAQFVGWYNGHPDFAGLPVRFDHDTAVIFGHGNVAIDIARILLSDLDRLAKTDIADHALEALRESEIRKVHLVGRRGPIQATFTTAELRELVLGLNVHVIIDRRALDFDADEQAVIGLPRNVVSQRNIRVLQEAAADAIPRTSGKELFLTFFASPVAIRGEGCVQRVEFVRNELDGPAENRRARATSEAYSLRAGLAISSVGFRGQPIADIPFDPRKGTIPNEAGRVIGLGAGGDAPLYVTGWIKRGATGVIGCNRADATETVKTLVADLRAGRWCVKHRQLKVELPDVTGRVDFAGWSLIDRAEIEAGREYGRPRRKFVSVEAMRRIARVKELSAS
jgi:ferredoxin--NADP+ reductase